MTAAEVDGATFAIGSVQLADADHVETAVAAMKTALVRNIRGTIRKQSSASTASMAGKQARRQVSADIEAVGHGTNGAALLLTGCFLARDRRIYQVIVLARDKQLTADDVDMFLRSFRLD